MSKGAWHSGHNFTDHKTRVLYFIAPKAWDEHIPPAVIPSDEETKFYKGTHNASLPDMRSALAGTGRATCTDDIGHFPAEGDHMRKTGAIYAVHNYDKLNNIHGTKHPMLLRFIKSNDFGNFGEMVLAAGGFGPRYSESDCHKGDGCLYCIDGPIIINLDEIQESYVVQEGDTFFLPAGTSYQLVNFEAKPVKAVFGITQL